MRSNIFYTIIAFAVTLLLGQLIIPILNKLKLGQHIREEGPKSHLVKAGTPTMGGIIFISATAITLLSSLQAFDSEGMIALYAMIAFGAIGAIDDLLSLLKGRNLGLTALQKMILLILISLFFGIYAVETPSIGTSIIVPFIYKTINLGIFYIPFIIFYFAATTNAANLTDGLDGLASTVSLCIIVFLTVVSFASGHYTLALFSAIMSGSLLGFLLYNSYPAKVIMGDTGALAIGGAIAVIAMILKLPLLIPIIGGIYFLEALSVLLQVTYFKATGKRIFKMSPIHHHFELSGWHETKIVVTFAIATAILCLISLASIFRIF